MTSTAVTAAANASPSGASGSDGGFVTVRTGDTLWGLARTHGVSVGALEAANPQVLHPDLIRPGQVLRMPAQAENGAGHGAQAAAAEHAPAHAYVVRSGDTLIGIGRKLGLDWRTLAQLNGVSRPAKLQAGGVLKLDGTHAARVAAPQGSVGASPAAGSPAAASPAGASPAGASTGASSVGAPGTASLAAARYAQAHVEAHSRGKCYAYVKTALQQSGAVAGHLSGIPAKGAGPQLEANGFHNVLHDPAHSIRSPYDAPTGAVLVYGAAPGATDKNVKYGHIEIRTATGFASDYASPRARTGVAANGLEGRGRELIGVYVKPDTGALAAAPPTRPAAAPSVPAATAPTAAATGAYSAQNLRLGVNADHAADIDAAAQRSGLAPQAVAALIDAEAAHDRTGAWNTQSYNADSHAGGLTQFLPSTWIGQAQRPGGYVHQQAQAAGFLDAQGQVAPEHRQQVLDMRFDARTSIFAAADYARSNVDALQRSGDLPANLGPGETAQAAYLAHHEGQAGARRMLNDDTGQVSERQFRTNVPARDQQRLLDAAGGDRGQAYRTWLNGYVDSHIDPRRFMADAAGVAAPRVERLGR